MESPLTIRWLIKIIALQFLTLSLAASVLLWFAKSGW